MKYLVFIIILFTLLNTGCVSDKKSNCKTDSINDSLYQKDIDSVQISDNSRFYDDGYYSEDSIIINLSKFKYNGLNEFKDITSLNSTENTLQEQIGCLFYHSDLSFSNKFNTYVFYGGEEITDGYLGFVLFNVDNSGHIISKLILTEGSTWEHYDIHKRFKFINDSTIKIYHKNGGVDVDSIGQYKLTWSTTVAITTFKIGDSGFIYLQETDTIKEMHHGKSNYLLDFARRDYDTLLKVIDFPLELKIYNLGSNTNTILKLEKSDSLLMNLIPNKDTILSFRRKGIYSVIQREAPDTAKLVFARKNVPNLEYIFVLKNENWKLIKIDGLLDDKN